MIKIITLAIISILAIICLIVFINYYKQKKYKESIFYAFYLGIFFENIFELALSILSK